MTMKRVNIFLIGSLIILQLIQISSRITDAWFRNSSHLAITKTAINFPYRCPIDQSSCQITSDFSQLDRVVWKLEFQSIKNENNVILAPYPIIESQSAETILDAVPILFNPDLYWLAKGGIYYREQNVSAAVLAWKEGFHIERYLQNLARENSQIYEALSLYELSISVQPTVESYYEMGKLLIDLDKEDEAIINFNQALYLSSQIGEVKLRPLVLTALGNTYRRNGNLELAIKKYNEALNIRADLPGAIIGLAKIDLVDGEYHVAINRIQSAMDLFPNNPHLMHFLANIFVDFGRTDDAREILEKLLINYVDYAPAWELLGEILLQVGDRKGALEAYGKYLSLVPDDEDARMEIEKLRE